MCIWSRSPSTNTALRRACLIFEKEWCIIKEDDAALVSGHNSDNKPRLHNNLPFNSNSPSCRLQGIARNALVTWGWLHGDMHPTTNVFVPSPSHARGWDWRPPALMYRFKMKPSALYLCIIDISGFSILRRSYPPASVTSIQWWFDKEQQWPTRGAAGEERKGKRDVKGTAFRIKADFIFKCLSLFCTHPTHLGYYTIQY